MPGCRLLIIDDDDDILDALEALMRSEGFEVAVARSGFAALTDLTYGRVRPQAILLDCLMPSMSGDQFLAVVRRHPSWSRIPVIVCSAGGVPADMSSTAFGVLQKPFDLDELLTLVRRACGAS